MKDDNRDIEEIRAIGDRLGMPSHDPDAEIPIESADEFIARMKAAGIEPGTAEPVQLANRRRRRLLFAAAAAAAVAVLTTLGVVLPRSSNTAYADTPPMLTYGFADSGKVAYAPGRPARASLLHLAEVSLASRPIQAVDRGTQHIQTSGWYARLDSHAASHSARVIPTLRDSRLEPDGTLVATESRGAPLGTDGRGLSANSAASKATDTIPPGSFDPAWASSLGSDPESVRQQLLKHADCESTNEKTTTACLVNEIVKLHESWVVTPRLRSALWTILSEQRDVRSLGNVTDRAGRPGIGFAIDSNGPPALRTILIIGRQDGRLLGTEEVLKRDDPDTKVEAPAVYAFTAVLKSEWIESGHSS